MIPVLPCTRRRYIEKMRGFHEPVPKFRPATGLTEVSALNNEFWHGFILSQNLAVLPLVSVGLQKARIGKSFSQFLPPVT
jgi:hypothetical protein